VTGPWYHLHIIYGHQWTIRVDVMQNIIIVACLRLLITRNTALFWGQMGAIKAKCLFNMFEHNNTSCLIDQDFQTPLPSDLLILGCSFLTSLVELLTCIMQLTLPKIYDGLSLNAAG